MPGCNTCKHHHSNLVWSRKEKKHRLEMSCLADKNISHIKWWGDNGSKIPPAPIDEMLCHEETDNTKHLREMSSMMDEMLTIIKEKK